MRVLLLSFCILLSSLAFAQKNKIGLSFSNNIVGQTSSGYTPTLTKPLPSVTPNSPPTFLNQPVKEGGKYGFSASINYERILNNKLSIFSGILFINSGFTTDKEYLRFRSQYVEGRGYILSALETYNAAKFNYTYYQIGLPVGVNYFIPIKKVKFFVGAGVRANYLLSAKYKATLYLSDDTETITDEEDNSLYRKINVSALLNFGVEYNLNTNCALRVSPQAQYTFTNIASKNAGYKIHPYSVGLAISVLHNL